MAEMVSSLSAGLGEAPDESCGSDVEDELALELDDNPGTTGTESFSHSWSDVACGHWPNSHNFAVSLCFETEVHLLATLENTLVGFWLLSPASSLCFVKQSSDATLDSEAIRSTRIFRRGLLYTQEVS